MQHDWEKLRVEYVTTLKSYTQLSEEHGIQRSLLGRRARMENWPVQRAAYRKKVTSDAIKRQGNKESKHLAALIDAADMLAYQVLEAVNDEEQFRRYFDSAYEKGADGRLHHVHDDFVSEKVDTKAMSNTARTIADLTRTIRNLNSLPDYQDKAKERMEKRKQKLLEEKNGSGLREGEYGVAEIAARMPLDENAVEVAD